ncbi:imidazoleglycerol-phosphate dehydratase [Artemisia annua]|uniref:imidazoleglycerol-phosphate dehydratase n=1 Tax=Artemisia annua TaxID=35608 RepID=A0A2U1M3X2_ARTAN|nr:imidazoleglycerol-phosphate dehydratase [Artemisia annua]
MELLSLPNPSFIAHVTNPSSSSSLKQQTPSVAVLHLQPINKHPLISINQMKPTTACNATSSVTTHHSVDPTIVVKEVEDRIGSVKRVTNETNVEVELNLDGVGTPDSNTGIPFLDHMLDQLASHGLFDVHVKAVGDIHIDDHHTNEDVALAIGTALLNALGDRKGINRFGDFTAPLDEALIHVTLVSVNCINIITTIINNDNNNCYDDNKMKIISPMLQCAYSGIFFLVPKK